MKIQTYQQLKEEHTRAKRDLEAKKKLVDELDYDKVPQEESLAIEVAALKAKLVEINAREKLESFRCGE